MGDRVRLDSCAIPVHRYCDNSSRQPNLEGNLTTDPPCDWKHSNGIADNNPRSPQMVHFFNMMNKNRPAGTRSSNPNEDFQCDDEDSMDTSTGPSENLDMELYHENDQMQITSRMDQISISDMVLPPDITLTDVDGPVSKPAAIHREDGTFLTVPQPEIETEPRRPPMMM